MSRLIIRECLLSSRRRTDVEDQGALWRDTDLAPARVKTTNSRTTTATKVQPLQSEHVLRRCINVCAHTCVLLRPSELRGGAEGCLRGACFPSVLCCNGTSVSAEMRWE